MLKGRLILRHLRIIAVRFVRFLTSHRQRQIQLKQPLCSGSQSVVLPVNARVVDFTLTLSALLTRKTQTQSSAGLWWTTADSPERFRASFPLRKIRGKSVRG